jgi:integrase
MQHSDDTPQRRVDTRQWEHRPKYGRRLQRQVGIDRFKSKVPDPARPGADRSKTFTASGWQEAERLHRERLGQADTNELPTNTKQTLDELAERRWEILEGLVASGERAETTLESDRLLYRKHLQPSLGRVRVERMQSSHVSKLLSGLRRSGLSAGSINRIYSVLRSILNLEPTAAGILKGLAKAERPSITTPETPSRCLTDEQVSNLLYFSLPATKVLNAIYAYTGVRQAEGLGLVWGDFDLTAGTVHVQAQLSRKKRGQEARRLPLKSARRRLGGRERDIDLHPDLVAMLKRHKAAQFEKGLAGARNFVTCTARGEPHFYRNALRDLGTAADRAGLNEGDVPQLSTHDLRHTAISRWIAASLDEATVARMAGDTVEVIHSTYLHEFERARRQQEIRDKLVAGTGIKLV